VRNYQIMNVNKGGYYSNSGNVDSGGTLNVAGTCYIGTYFNLTGVVTNSLNVLDGGIFTAGNAVNLTTGTGNQFNVYSNGVANVLGNLTIITGNTNRVAGFEYLNQINSSGGEIRLSDGTTAGTLLLSNGIAPIVANTLRFVGGSPDMSTLIVSNSVQKTFQAAVQLGGAGANENNLRLIKDNIGTLTLSSVNSYTGDTIVRAGTLQFTSTPATNSRIDITNSGTNGVLQLSFSTTNVVKALVVNGTPAYMGVHNATTDPGVITGGGSLLVLTGPAPPLSSNANLTGITLNPAAALSPAFASNTLSYAASVAYGSLLAVTVTNADLTATNHVTINGTPLGVVASGVESAPAQALPANPAVPNVVTVQVTAQDGVTVKTYTVNVTQLPSQTQPVVSNSYNSGTGVLTLDWPLANLGYRLLAQTNNLAAGVSANLSDWGAVPGSQATNTLSISTTNQNEFFQLVYP
jgi:autotransporter-associated beta strand protein